MYCRAGPTFTHVIFSYIGCGAAITSGELHGCGQGCQEAILAVRLGWPANAQVGLEACFFFRKRIKLTGHVCCADIRSGNTITGSKATEVGCHMLVRNMLLPFWW